MNLQQRTPGFLKIGDNVRTTILLDKDGRICTENNVLLETLAIIASVADQSGLASRSTYDGILEDIREMAVAHLRDK